MFNISLLPELNYKILCFSKINVIRNIPLVNKAFNNLLCDKEFWKLKFKHDNLEMLRDQDFPISLNGMGWFNEYELVSNASYHAKHILIINNIEKKRFEKDYKTDGKLWCTSRIPLYEFIWLDIPIKFKKISGINTDNVLLHTYITVISEKEYEFYVEIGFKSNRYVDKKVVDKDTILKLLTKFNYSNFKLFSYEIYSKSSKDVHLSFDLANLDDDSIEELYYDDYISSCIMHKRLGILETLLSRY